MSSEVYKTRKARYIAAWKKSGVFTDVRAFLDDLEQKGKPAPIRYERAFAKFPIDGDPTTDSPQVPGTPGYMEEYIDGGRCRNKDALLPEIYAWVARNMCEQEVTPEDCLCPEAWTDLWLARQSTGNKMTFMTAMRGKAHPTGAQVDAKAKMEDDGRSLDGMVKKLGELAAESAGTAETEAAPVLKIYPTELNTEAMLDRVLYDRFKAEFPDHVITSDGSVLELRGRSVTLDKPIQIGVGVPEDEMGGVAKGVEILVTRVLRSIDEAKANPDGESW